MNKIGNTLCLDKQCLEMARKQFCLDIGLPWEEYVKKYKKPVFIQKAVYESNTLDIASVGARNYSERDSFFRAIICLGQLFICCDESIYDWVVEQYGLCKPEWFCDYKNLRKLDEKLKASGHRIYDTHVYFLPEAGTLNSGRKEITMKCEDSSRTAAELDEASERVEPRFVWFEQEEILHFKENNRFASAISFWSRHPDMLAVAQVKDGYSGETKCFDQSHMAGMAGVSQDGEYLWQIGINVDKEYAGQGIGHRLVRALKEEILKRGKVPFYGTSESHTISQTVGLKAGFVPAWTEVSVEKI